MKRRHWMPLALGLAILALSVVMGWRTYEVTTAYAAAADRIDRLRTLSGSDAVFSAATLSQARSELQQLNWELERIDRATALPVGEALAAQLPWVGAQYAEARRVVRIGVLAAEAGSIVAEVGGDLLEAIEPGSGLTWLDALAPHQLQLMTAAQDVRTIRSLRASVDGAVLPERIRRRLGDLDRVLERPEVEALTSVDLSATWTALGGSARSTYLVAFQNPAELRPTGGFPGTMALVNFEHGQLGGYQFFSAHELTGVYLDHRTSGLRQPWPIQRYFPQPEFLLHDALWWPDFPRGAQQLMAMYAETGWPRIDGVIAVQPEVASKLVELTGPFTVEFEGQAHRITAENVYSQIDGQRIKDVEKPEDVLVHKAMLGLIGKNLIERLKSVDKRVLLSSLQEFSTACQRRDIQIYAADPEVQAELDRLACAGRLQPLDGQPTLAVTYANLVLSKTSLDMRPRLSLSVDPVEDGQRHVRMTIDLRNGATADEDAVYAGFQRWWVQVYLPAGSTLLSDRGAIEDPDAPNGGSYLAELFPDTTGRINLRFSMPDTRWLLVRRQPGVRAGDVVASQPGCQPALATELDRDLLVDLATICS